jgi:hypothetical protein
LQDHKILKIEDEGEGAIRAACTFFCKSAGSDFKNYKNMQE